MTVHAHRHPSPPVRAGHLDRGIQRAAVQAEALGFDDVWVSDHLVVPADQAYPGPYLYDPLMALAFAGAVTDRGRAGHQRAGGDAVSQPAGDGQQPGQPGLPERWPADRRRRHRLVAGRIRGPRRGLRPARPAAGGDHLVVADGLAGRSRHPRRRLLPLPRTSGSCPSRPTTSRSGSAERATWPSIERPASPTATTASGSAPRTPAPWCSAFGPYARTRASPSPCACHGTPAPSRRPCRPTSQATRRPGSSISCTHLDRGDIDAWLQGVERLAVQVGAGRGLTDARSGPEASRMHDGRRASRDRTPAAARSGGMESRTGEMANLASLKSEDRNT